MFFEIPARLHLGLLDLSKDFERRFGGIGCSIEQPKITFEIEKSDSVEIQGERKERATEYAEKILKSLGINNGVKIDIKGDLQEHVGLGSGTQLALGIGYGIAKLYGIKTTAEEIFRITGRGDYSSAGLHTFVNGGFILEGGKKGTVAPLLFKSPIPKEWNFLVVTPKKQSVYGSKEKDAFSRINAKDPEMARLVLMKLLPGLIENDIDEFGSALNEIQERTGKLFKGAQGGIFNKDTAAGIKILKDRDICRGQSSWGPTFYGLSDSKKKLKEAETEIREKMDVGASYITKANNKGFGSRF